jgi:hypothetical protein
VKNPKHSRRNEQRPNAALARPGDSKPRSSLASEATGSERQVAEKPDSAKNYKAAVRSYRFQRARTSGIIEVLNENSYVMAEYSERTGVVRWQRMVLASQREQIEKWLEDHYPKA